MVVFFVKRKAFNLNKGKKIVILQSQIFKKQTILWDYLNEILLDIYCL